MRKEFVKKTEILKKDEIDRALTRISHEILEKNGGAKNISIIGIRTRGIYLARRIADKIGKIEGSKIDVGELDITFYRDDLTRLSQPEVHKTEILFDINNRNIILVDDVLYTGRTIRAAMDALIDFGRPLSIQLAVMVDRGHRELPIKADYVGKNIPTATKEEIKVNLAEVDEKDSVILGEIKD